MTVTALVRGKPFVDAIHTHLHANLVWDYFSHLRPPVSSEHLGSPLTFLTIIRAPLHFLHSPPKTVLLLSH